MKNSLFSINKETTTLSFIIKTLIVFLSLVLVFVSFFLFLISDILTEAIFRVLSDIKFFYSSFYSLIFSVFGIILPYFKATLFYENKLIVSLFSYILLLSSISYFFMWFYKEGYSKHHIKFYKLSLFIEISLLLFINITLFFEIFKSSFEFNTVLYQKITISLFMFSIATTPFVLILSIFKNRVLILTNNLTFRENFLIQSRKNIEFLTNPVLGFLILLSVILLLFALFSNDLAIENKMYYVWFIAVSILSIMHISTLSIFLKRVIDKSIERTLNLHNLITSKEDIEDLTKNSCISHLLNKDVITYFNIDDDKHFPLLYLDLVSGIFYNFNMEKVGYIDKN